MCPFFPVNREIDGDWLARDCLLRHHDLLIKINNLSFEAPIHLTSGFNKIFELRVPTAYCTERMAASNA